MVSLVPTSPPSLLALVVADIGRVVRGVIVGELGPGTGGVRQVAHGTGE